MCILSDKTERKTFFYYPDIDSITEISQYILCLEKTRLNRTIIVLIRGLKYLYNVFTREKVELPLDSLTDRIIVSQLEPQDIYFDSPYYLNIYVVDMDTEYLQSQADPRYTFVRAYKEGFLETAKLFSHRPELCRIDYDHSLAYAIENQDWKIVDMILNASGIKNLDLEMRVSAELDFA